MEENNSLIQGSKGDFVVLSLIFSLLALFIAVFSLKTTSVEFSIDSIINKSLAFGGIVATIYFGIYGIRLSKYKKDLDETRNRLESTNTEAEKSMLRQYEETYNLFDSIQGINGNHQNATRYAMGKFICNSKYSNDDQKEKGIMYLGQYGRKQEDIDLLQRKIVDNANSSKRLKELANGAIGLIQQRL